MSTNDCGACAEIKNCNRAVTWKQYPTLAFRLLCDIWDALAAMGGGGSWDKIAFPALSNTVETVMDAPGEFGGYYFFNPNDDPVLIQLFDTIGDVTLGTTEAVPLYGLDGFAAANVFSPRGVEITAGLKIAVTALDGTTAPVTGIIATLYFREE